MSERVNPEMILEVYETLDTVQEDTQKLLEEHQALEPELMSGVQDLCGEATVRMLLDQDKRKRSQVMEQRRSYAVSSLRGLNYKYDDILVANAEYLAQFDNQDDKVMDDAIERAHDYQVLAIGLMKHAEIVYSSDSEGAVPPAKPSVGYANVYTNDNYINPEAKRTDADGKTWINLCHPRGVLRATSKKESAEQLVADAITIAKLRPGTVTEDDSGVMHVEFRDGRTSMSFEKGSTLYRLDDSGQVHVIRPGNIVGSIMETEYTSEAVCRNGRLSRRSEALEVAEAAAGAPGSIWDTFDDQRGNPHTLSVAKRN